MKKLMKAVGLDWIGGVKIKKYLPRVRLRLKRMNKSHIKWTLNQMNMRIMQTFNYYDRNSEPYFRLPDSPTKPKKATYGGT